MKKVKEIRKRMVTKRVTNELRGIERLLNLYPNGIFSMVSDTYDLWRMCTVYLPTLKNQIMSRDGKLVIRPDSGNPVDIICGTICNHKDISKHFPEGEVLAEYFEDYLLEEVSENTPHGEHGDSEYTQRYIVRGNLYVVTIHNISWNRHDKQYYYIDMYEKARITINKLEITPEMKGVVELLWDEFQGTVNEQGYKVLDSHVGVIYGDSITLERCNEIARRLEEKGFATTNVVFGIGSFTYQYNTRDTFGFALKATYVEKTNLDLTRTDTNGETVYTTVGEELFKDPITDNGVKKSAKGLVKVVKEDGVYVAHDQVTWDEFVSEENELKVIYRDGKFTNRLTFDQIRETVKNQK